MSGIVRNTGNALKHFFLERIAALMNVIPESVFLIIEFSCYTGFRLENILSMRIEEIRFHDLRHVFSNWLHCNGEGATFDQLRTLLGHKDRSTTDKSLKINGCPAWIRTTIS